MQKKYWGWLSIIVSYLFQCKETGECMFSSLRIKCFCLEHTAI